jgi:hypothetical protein
MEIDDPYMLPHDPLADVRARLIAAGLDIRPRNRTPIKRGRAPWTHPTEPHDCSFCMSVLSNKSRSS